jgi:hypothetical protein
MMANKDLFEQAFAGAVKDAFLVISVSASTLLHANIKFHDSAQH